MSDDPVTEEIRRFFAGDPHGAVAVWLFGSRARGTAREDSDVDVGVLLAADPPEGWDGLPLDVEGDLERRLRQPVQVVALNRAPADLVHRVLRDGLLLLDLDPGRRIAFEVRRRAEFLDLLPVLREYRRPRSRGRA